MAETVFAEQTCRRLFAAPPVLCERLGRTILYGLVPVASADESDIAPPAPDYANLPPDEAAAMRQHFSEYFKQRPLWAMPNAGARAHAGVAAAGQQPADDTEPDD